ncbi:hypothetical protein AVEN_154049-1, partial [Araneus ventricosus]
MTRMTPDLAPYLPNFRTTPAQSHLSIPVDSRHHG